MWAEAESFSWIDRDDRLFCAIPLFHTYGMGCCLLAAIRQGATLVFLDDPHRSSCGAAARSSCSITIFPGVPFNFRLLAERPRTRTSRRCDSASRRARRSRGRPPRR
jgi:long-chain acyl-CoA synthetase